MMTSQSSSSTCTPCHTSSCTLQPSQKQQSKKHQHQQQRQQRWSTSWAHVQQRIRRNCLVGPIAFLCLVVMIGIQIPCSVWQTTTSSATRTTLILQQYLPFVEAVPFFRRSLNNNHKLPASNSHGKGQEQGGTALGVATATATATTTATNNKRKRTTTTATTTDYSQFNFPLLTDSSTSNDPQSFANNPTAPIPLRYLEAHQMNEAPARKATLATLEWRRTNAIDTILQHPNTHYDVAKRILPHYFVGFSKASAKDKASASAAAGHVIFIQRPGLADLALAKHNDISIDDMLHQYAYVFEYCWNVLHPSPSETQSSLMISIIDLQGVNLSILRKPELLNFVKEFVAMIDAHYPSRAYKTYMINAPSWFSTLYKLISPILRETTKEKIVLYSAGPQQQAALAQALGDDALAKKLEQALRIPTKQERQELQQLKITDSNKKFPPLTSDILLETEMEQQIRNFVLERLDYDGLEMQEIVPVPSSN